MGGTHQPQRNTSCHEIANHSSPPESTKKRGEDKSIQMTVLCGLVSTSKIRTIAATSEDREWKNGKRSSEMLRRRCISFGGSRSSLPITGVRMARRRATQTDEEDEEPHELDPTGAAPGLPQGAAAGDPPWVAMPSHGSGGRSASVGASQCVLLSQI